MVGEPAEGSAPDSAAPPGRRLWNRRRPRIEEVGERPDYRFTLANERTFLAWIRTALALVAGGIAVVQLVPEFSVFSGARHVLGVILIVLAIVVSATCYRRWDANERALRLNEPLPPSRLPLVIAAGSLVVTLLALVFIVFSKGTK